MQPSYASKINEIVSWNHSKFEKYKDCELTKGLKLDEKFKVINYKEEEVQYCDDIEILVGDKQNPIVCRRKKGKGFVYSICTNSHNMPECLVSNLIK